MIGAGVNQSWSERAPVCAYGKHLPLGIVLAGSTLPYGNTITEVPDQLRLAS